MATGFRKGYVVGLRQYLNDWYAQKVQEVYIGNVTVPTAAITQVASTRTIGALSGIPSDLPDLYANYTLIERVGNVAIWKLDIVFVIDWAAANELVPGFVDLDTSPILSLGTSPTRNYDGAGSDPLAFLRTQDTVAWDQMYFMTVAIPWQTATVRDTVVDQVVAIHDGPDGIGGRDIWAMLNNEMWPDAISWGIDAQNSNPPADEFIINPTHEWKRKGASL